MVISKFKLGPVKKLVAKNMLIQVAGRAVALLFGVIIVMIITRSLGPVGFGEYTTVFGFLGMFSVFAVIGFNTYATREIAKEEKSASNVLSSIFTLQLVVVTVVMLTAVGVAWLMPYSMGVKVGIVGGAVAIVFQVLNMAIIAYFQAKVQIWKIVLGDLSAKVVILLLALFIWKTSNDLLGFIGAVVAGNVAMFLVSFLFLNHKVKLRLRFDVKGWKRIIKELLPLSVATILSFALYKIDILTLSLVKGSEAVGYYGAAYKVVDYLILLPTFLMMVVFPLMSKASQDGVRSKTLLVKSLKLMILSGVGVLVFFVPLASWVIKVLAGSDFLKSVSFMGHTFAGSASVLQILVVGVALMFISRVFWNYFVALNRTKELIVISGVAVALNTVLNVLLVASWSFIGSAVATVLSELCCLVMYVVLFVRRKI